MLLAGRESLDQLIDGARLIAARFVAGDELKIHSTIIAERRILGEGLGPTCCRVGNRRAVQFSIDTHIRRAYDEFRFSFCAFFGRLKILAPSWRECLPH